MVGWSGHCRNHDLSEIVVSVKMPIARDGTKRPREPLLQLSIDLGHPMCRIGRRLRSLHASVGGAILEIRPFGCPRSNALEVRTLLGG